MVGAVSGLMPGRKVGERRGVLGAQWKEHSYQQDPPPGLQKEEKIQAMRIKIAFRKN